METTIEDESAMVAKRPKISHETLSSTSTKQQPQPQPQPKPQSRSTFIGDTLLAQVFGKDHQVVDLHVQATTISDEDVEVGVYASRDYAPHEIIGGKHCRGLHWKHVLDPVEVVNTHPLASKIRSCLTTTPQEEEEEEECSDDILFWICLASMALESEWAATQESSSCGDNSIIPNDNNDNNNHQNKDDGDSSTLKLNRHYTYLQSLPRVSPEPCSWNVTERRSYLQHTHLGIQVEKQYELLQSTYQNLAEKVGSGTHDSDNHHNHNNHNTTTHVPHFPPFDVDGQGKFGSFLWARGVHLSRSFPQQLLQAAKMKSSTTPPSSLVANNNDDNHYHHNNDTNDTDDTDDGVILRTELGGTLPPRISFSGDGGGGEGTMELQSTASPNYKASTPHHTTPAAATTTTTTTTTTTDGHPPPSIATNKLGVMLPFFDLCDHQSELPIVWEAGNNYIRFRFGGSPKGVSKGQPICNNYGPKGNQELLFTYGFALDGNPFDSVEGIVFGCPCHEKESSLTNARVRMLEDYNVPYQLKDNGSVLMMGPFALYRQPETQMEDESKDSPQISNITATTTTTTKLSEHHVVPAELYHGLSVLGMEHAEDDPAITPEDIDALVEQFQNRIEKLQRKVGEDADKCHDVIVWKKEFCKRYRQGEIVLLQMAIDEVKSLLQE